MDGKVLLPGHLLVQWMNFPKQQSDIHISCVSFMVTSRVQSTQEVLYYIYIYILFTQYTYHTFNVPHFHSGPTFEL